MKTERPALGCSFFFQLRISLSGSPFLLALSVLSVLSVLLARFYWVYWAGKGSDGCLPGGHFGVLHPCGGGLHWRLELGGVDSDSWLLAPEVRRLGLGWGGVDLPAPGTLAPDGPVLSALGNCMVDIGVSYTRVGVACAGGVAPRGPGD